MSGDLAGKRVLVVEDEYLIAADLTRALQRADAIVLGPVGEVHAGLELIDREAPDVAVLDVNLHGDMSFSIADRLHARNVPYLFLTGYDGWALPEGYRDAERIAKPMPVSHVLDRIAQLARPAASR